MNTVVANIRTGGLGSGWQLNFSICFPLGILEEALNFTVPLPPR